MMDEYLIDTEFIRATKERVHFIEVALLNPKSGQIFDFHINAKLNGWEKKYFDRALKGYYGPRTKNVFEAVNTLYSGQFNRPLVDSFCKENGYNYMYDKLSTTSHLVPKLENSILYAWDVSNDKDLFGIIDVNNVELVDVQANWQKRFGGNQISLIDAYKHVLYNSDSKDECNLLDYAHYACCDVMLLNVVMAFLAQYQGALVAIPVEREVLEKKLETNLENIQRWKFKCEEISNRLENTVEKGLLEELSRDLIKFKKKISAASKRNKELSQVKVYEKPWW